MDNVKKIYLYLENTDDTKVLQIIPWNGQSSCINSLSYYLIIIYSTIYSPRVSKLFDESKLIALNPQN